MSSSRESLVEDVVARFSSDQLARNGVPTEQTRAAREHAHEVLAQVLAPFLAAEGLRASPLGWAWTDVVEASLRSPVDESALALRGWVPLTLLSHRGGGAAAWLVVEGGRVLTAVRLHRGPAPDPAAVVVERCRTAGEVGLRDVLELAALRRQQARLPAASAVLSAAADIESTLGGRDLSAWATGRSTSAPAMLGRSGRRGRTVVAVSGVDGSGKTTLRSALVNDLQRVGVSVSTVWVRPGMGLGGLVRLADAAKRALGVEATPGLRAMAERPEGARVPRSRRGLVGWLWATLVTASFLANVRGQHRRARGAVVVYDRHLVDALATLDFAYEGVDLRLHHAAIRALLPRASVRLYLDVPAEVSVARKPDDLIGSAAVVRQLTAYSRWLQVTPPTHVLDATQDADALAVEALQVLGRSPVRPRRGPLGRRH